jgi:hypothetical protein
MGRLSSRLAALTAAILLGTLGALFGVRPAYACSCVAVTTADALRASDAVFAGTVTRTTDIGSAETGWTDVRFRVSTVYKGTVYADQVVATPQQPASCGLAPAMGSTWVIFATDAVEGTGHNAVDRLATGLCNGNLPQAGAPAILGTGRSPVPGASDREERATNADGALTRGIVIAGVSFLGVGLLLAAVIAIAWRRPAESAGPS